MEIKKTISRLVVQQYISNPENKEYVLHIDGNKLNDNVENLKWATKKEISESSNKDTSHPRRVIQKNTNGEILQTYNSVTEAGEAHGLSRYAISKACLKINKTSGGFIWDYEDESNNHSKDVDLEKGEKINGYDNYYAFPDGRIYNSQRKSFLKSIRNKSGYCYVTLSKQKIKKNEYIHTLIAKAFLVKPDDLNEINHKNKDKTDNSVENLEWISRSDNMIHAMSNISLKD